MVIVVPVSCVSVRCQFLVVFLTDLQVECSRYLSDFLWVAVEVTGNYELALRTDTSFDDVCKVLEFFLQFGLGSGFSVVAHNVDPALSGSV